MPMPSFVGIALAALAYVAAECPNACSGHGTCTLHDQCVCCRNWNGADCSERVCPFGYAHVDSPKGDLDGSAGDLSGPTTPIIAGSTVYPFGTTEQYPDAQDNEGHFYAECSNKGMCDRSSGLCECFEGYEGSSCQRSSCPNDCSGHGTCETIKELAEDKQAGDLVNGLGDLSGAHNLKYELWDKTMTMGCKCDGGYYGPDCSIKRCPYGVDPLFIPSNYDFSGTYVMSASLDLSVMGDSGAALYAPSYEISIVDIALNNQNAIGTMDLIFYDVFGEEYRLDGVKFGHYRRNIAYAAAGNTGANIHGTTYVMDPGRKGAKEYWTSNIGTHHSNRNVSICEDIMAMFPNEKLKDTRLGGTHHGSHYGVSHKGGLVSTAYAGSPTNNHANHTPSSYYKMSVAPFCTLMNHTKLKSSAFNTASATTHGIDQYDYGSRYVFDYNRGNPGYHKDMRVENAKINDDLLGAGATITYYTKRQGEVAEYVSSDTVAGTVKDSHTAADAALFAVTLPGYITEFKDPAIAGDLSKGTIVMSTVVDQYIGALQEPPAANVGAHPNLAATPYKTNWIAFTPVGETTQQYFNVTSITTVDRTLHNHNNVVLKTKVSQLEINLFGTSFCGNYLCDANSWTVQAEAKVAPKRITVKAKLKQAYTYVSECSNRGLCDTESGLCACFSGYTHENCDTQTPVC